jgi:hypothetical protein
VNRWLAQLLGAGAGRLEVVGPRPRVIGPSPTATVEPPARFAWDEKRWSITRVGERVELFGEYHVCDQRATKWRVFQGHISQQAGQIAAYISDPPTEMKQHPHGSCLQLVNPPWFRLHWQRPPATLDDALLYMEQMLDESFNGNRR